MFSPGIASPGAASSCPQAPINRGFQNERRSRRRRAVPAAAGRRSGPASAPAGPAPAPDAPPGPAPQIIAGRPGAFSAGGRCPSAGFRCGGPPAGSAPRPGAGHFPAGRRRFAAGHWGSPQERFQEALFARPKTPPFAGIALWSSAAAAIAPREGPGRGPTEQCSVHPLVAHPPHGLDMLPADLLPQAADVDGERIVVHEFPVAVP